MDIDKINDELAAIKDICVLMLSEEGPLDELHRKKGTHVQNIMTIVANIKREIES